MIAALMSAGLAWQAPGSTSPKVVDAATIAALDARDSLPPQEAVVLIDWRLSTPEVPWGVPTKALRRRIEGAVNRVAWPPLGGLAGFSTYLQRALPALLRAGQARRFDAALGLVCAAWDFDLGRRQFLPWFSGVVCTDPQVDLFQGRRKEADRYSGVSSYLSREWPWRRQGSRFVLGAIELPAFAGGMVGLTVSRSIQGWRDQDREKEWGDP